MRRAYRPVSSLASLPSECVRDRCQNSRQSFCWPYMQQAQQFRNSMQLIVTSCLYVSSERRTDHQSQDKVSRISCRFIPLQRTLCASQTNFAGLTALFTYCLRRNRVALLMRCNTTTEPMKTIAKPITTTGSLNRESELGRRPGSIICIGTHTLRPGVSSFVYNRIIVELDPPAPAALVDNGFSDPSFKAAARRLQTRSKDAQLTRINKHFHNKRNFMIAYLNAPACTAFAPTGLAFEAVDVPDGVLVGDSGRAGAEDMAEMAERVKTKVNAGLGRRNCRGFGSGKWQPSLYDNLRVGSLPKPLSLVHKRRHARDI